MEKIKKFFSKYGLMAFIGLLFIMMIRGCSKNGKINKLEKENTTLVHTINDLTETVDSVSNSRLTDEQIKLIELKGKSEVLDFVNNEISKYDRNKSMMELQFEVIGRKKNIDSKIKSIEKNR